VESMNAWLMGLRECIMEMRKKTINGINSAIAMRKVWTEVSVSA